MTTPPHTHSDQRTVTQIQKALTLHQPAPRMEGAPLSLHNCGPESFGSGWASSDDLSGLIQLTGVWRNALYTVPSKLQGIKSTSAMQLLSCTSTSAHPLTELSPTTVETSKQAADVYLLGLLAWAWKKNRVSVDNNLSLPMRILWWELSILSCSMSTHTHTHIHTHMSTHTNNINHKKMALTTFFSAFIWRWCGNRWIWTDGLREKKVDDLLHVHTHTHTHTPSYESP